MVKELDELETVNLSGRLRRRKIWVCPSGTADQLTEEGLSERCRRVDLLEYEAAEDVAAVETDEE